MTASTQAWSGKRWIRSTAICGDASTRSYERLRDKDGLSAILARYPETGRAELQRDLEVLRWCRDRGLHVPLILEESLDRCMVILEDLGEIDAEGTVLATCSEHRLALCHRLISPLAALADIRPEELPPWNAPLDGGRMRWELAGFELWFMGNSCEQSPTSEISAWLDTLALEIASHPIRVCHRDYHLNNLFFLANDDVGIIDIQDILLGPDTYDAVSLLAERAMPELMDQVGREAWLSAWARESGAHPGWHHRRPLVQIQRGLKVLGTFARLMAGGRREYGPWMPAIVKGLEAPLRSAHAPPVLVDCLLHWCESGGPHVR